MGRPLRLLIVEDSPIDAEIMLRELQRGGFDPVAQRVETGEEMRAALGQPWNIILADYTLPTLSGREALSILKQSGREIPFILVSGTIREEFGMDVMRAGADDYISKDSLVRLAPVVDRELRETAHRQLVAQAASQCAALVESSEDAIVSSTLEGVITSWNRAAEGLLGWSAAEAVGRPLALVVPLDRAGEMAEVLEWLKRGGRIDNFETVRVHKNGARVDVSVTISPIQDVGGEVIGAATIARDISRWKRIEQALRQAEAQYHTLAESIPQLVWTVWTDGSGAYCNDRLRAYTGLLRGESFTDAWERLVHPEDWPSFQQRWEQALELEEPFEAEGRWRRADGVYLWHLVRAVLLRDEAGRGTRWFGTATDVDAHIRAEETLHRERELLGAVLETIAEAVITFDLNGTIIYHNQAAEKLFQMLGVSYSPYWWEKHIGFWQIDGTTPLERQDWPHARALRGESVLGGEVVVTGLSGLARQLVASARPLRNGAGARMGAVLALLDVTDHRRLEEQFFHAQKMEAIGQLASGVAHDFNNLLTVINGCSEFLLLTLPTDNTWRGPLEEIQKAGERAATLTHQLLTFARKQPIAPRPLDLNQVVRDNEDILRRALGRSIEVVLELQPDLALVLADSGQMSQVLLNLTVNARDAMPRGGCLTITTANVVLDEDYARVHVQVKPGPHVVLAVEDTGHGIPPEVKTRMFEPFFTTKGPGRGTGLGLSTVFGIIRQSEGHIEVNSQLGMGTTFRIYLPCLK